MKTDLSTYLRTIPDGYIAVCTEDGLGTFNVKEFIDQPWEGILWDLNRDAATCLTNLKESGDLIWVNNYASGQVIRALKERIDELEGQIASSVENLSGIEG